MAENNYDYLLSLRERRRMRLWERMQLPPPDVNRQRFDTVIWQLKKKADEKAFKAIDISHFDYKDYDNVIIQLCYDYYQEHCAGRLVETIDDAKRYIIQMSNWEYMRNK